MATTTLPSFVAAARILSHSAFQSALAAGFGTVAVASPGFAVGALVATGFGWTGVGVGTAAGGQAPPRNRPTAINAARALIVTLLISIPFRLSGPERPSQWHPPFFQLGP